MNAMCRTVGVGAIIVSIGLAGVLSYSAGANRLNLLGRPSSVVTVNLQNVIDKLDQRADAEISLKKRTDDLKSEDDKRKAEIKEMQDQIQAATAGSKPRQDLQEKFAMMSLEYQAWARFAADTMDIERSLLLQDIYVAIKREVKGMASSEGFDIVLVDDSQGELTINPQARVDRETQIRQQVISRRMLYANPDVDITNELITRMNNAYKASPASKPLGPQANPANPNSKPAKK
jgi:Skp family chaperone for outer membrane proteins